MRYFLQLSILSAVLFFAAPLSAKACSCFSSGPPCQAFWSFPTVFSGEVKEIIDPPAKEKVLADGQRVYSYQRKKVRFAVTESFRGIEGETVEIDTGRGGGDCGYPFQVGEKYLVYAYKNQETGELGASICSRTQLLEKAAEDLEYFRSLKTAESGASVYGYVMQTFARKNDAPYQKPAPLAGISILLEGSGGERIETKTDETGAYRLSGLKAGEYQISLKAPENLWGHEKPSTIKVFDKGCVTPSFYLQTKTFLSGRLLDENSKPVSEFAVHLVPVEQVNNSRHFDLKTSFTDDAGRFDFRSIPDGKYYLGIRLSGISDILFRYPQTFYPGTPNLNEAKVITISEGQILENFDFKLPKKLGVRKVSGIVVFPDGTPAANASIGINETEYFYSFYYFSPTSTKADGSFSFDIVDGIRYLVKPVVSAKDTPSRQRHAEPVEIPANGDVTNLKFVITEPNGNCEKCFSPKATVLNRPK